MTVDDCRNCRLAEMERSKKCEERKIQSSRIAHLPLTWLDEKLRFKSTLVVALPVSSLSLSLSLSLSFTLSALSMHRSTVAGRRRKKLGLAPMTSEQAQPVIKIGTQRPLEIMLNDSNLFRAFEIKFDEMEKTNFARQITFSFVTATTVAAERRHEQELTRDNDEILCTLNAISKLFLNLHYIFDFMVSIGKSCFNLIWIRFENKKIIWLKSDISAVPRIHEPWKLIKRAMTTTTTMCLATN